MTTAEDERGDRGLEVAIPPYLFPAYQSTVLRAPERLLVVLPEALADRRGPVLRAPASSRP